MLTLDMVREAQEALRGIARRTPLDRAPKFGENVYIKAENLQLTGAFKLRGAYNKIRSLTPEEAARGVIACSAAEAGLPDRGRSGGGRGVHVPVPPRRGPHGAAERVHHCGRHRGEEAG